MCTQSDVIVVGAGPAGSTAATVLAQQGLNVLLLDREQFPRDKPCGDVVPLGCFIELRKLGLPVTEIPGYPIRRIVLSGSQEGKRTFDVTAQHAEQGELTTSVVPRSVFDQALVNHALACGAHFRRANVRGPLFENGHVIGVAGACGKQKEKHYARMVIGADGATSAIARGLGYRRARHDEWAVALRGYVNTEADLAGAIELAYLDEIQPGYAWFFPMDRRRANVGIGMRTDYYHRQDKTLTDLLDGYLSRPEIASRIGGNQVEQLHSWPLPFFSFERERVFDGALLAGDAGGFVHPITAAGIFSSMMTGKYAAQAAILALEKGDVSRSGLSTYTTLWHNGLAEEFRPAVTANKLVTVFPHLAPAALLLSGSDSSKQTEMQSTVLSSLGKF